MHLKFGMNLSVVAFLTLICFVSVQGAGYGFETIYGSLLGAYLSFRGQESENEIGTRMMATEETQEPMKVDWSFLPLPSSKPGTSSSVMCGSSNFNPMLRIVGGTEAKPGNWPWAAALGYQNANGDTKYRCGGTLISNRHILTAAHCVRLPSHEAYQLKGALLGVTDLRRGDSHDFKLIKKVYVSHFVAETHENDIAIISLAKAVKFNGLVEAACLPKSNVIDEPLQTYTAGWGATHYAGPGQALLQWAEMPQLNSSVCDKAYKEQNQVVDSRMICAGYVNGSKDACQGDSGGGLVARIGEVYYVIGVVSYGFQCGIKDNPGVYVRVGRYIHWIHSVMNLTQTRLD